MHQSHLKKATFSINFLDQLLELSQLDWVNDAQMVAAIKSLG